MHAISKGIEQRSNWLRKVTAGGGGRDGREPVDLDGVDKDGEVDKRSDGGRNKAQRGDMDDGDGQRGEG